MADLHVERAGCIVILTPVSPAGHLWMRENIEPGATRYGQCSIAIERNYFGPIADGAISDGLDLS